MRACVSALSLHGVLGGWKRGIVSIKSSSPFRRELAEEEIRVEGSRGKDGAEQVINVVDHKVITWRCRARGRHLICT